MRHSRLWVKTQNERRKSLVNQKTECENIHGHGKAAASPCMQLCDGNLRRESATGICDGNLRRESATGICDWNLRLESATGICDGNL